MSNESQDQEKLFKANSPQIYDDVLATLVGQSVAELMTFGITLIVDGTLVSGTTIGAKEFFNELGKQLDDALPGENQASAFESMFSKAFSDLEEDKAPEDRRPNVSWIHLRDVTILGPDGSRINTRLWRGLLSHVGGWSLGQPNFE